MHARLAVQTRSNEKSQDNVEGGRGGGGGRRLFESIRTLNIYSNMVIPEKLVVDLKPCFGFLETVKIELMKLISTTINIFTILDNGPRLKSVEIVALRDSLVEFTQGDTTPTSTTTTTTATTTTTEATAAPGLDQAITAKEQTNRPTHSAYYPLQQLILQGPCIDTFMTAERIIETCLDLRALKSIRIKTSTLYHNNQTQQEPSIIQEASKCLAAMARVHCPHLIWYQSDLQYLNHDLPNETRLIELTQMFPEMRALSMEAYEDSGPIFTPLHPPYQPVLQTPFLPDLINIFLNRIIILEVGAHWHQNANWKVVNRIICLCPHLQDLLISRLLTMTGQLNYPSCPPFESFDDQVLPYESLWLYDGSDKETRQRERRGRQNLRDLVLPVDLNNQGNHPCLDCHRSVPRIWPCRHTLRKLDCCLYYMMIDWVQHIQAYRLFGHLTSFKVGCEELRIGQIKACPNDSSQKSKEESLSSSPRKSRSTDAESEYRYQNDLLAPKSLVYLEEFVVEVAWLRGTVVPENFEFLRRKDPAFGTRFFPPPLSLSQQSMEARAGRKFVECTEGEDGEESDSEYDSENENDYGGGGAYKDIETFWPRLTTFHVVTHAVNDPTVLASAIERIRPGVDFCLKLLPHSPSRTH
ncbi:hypothetical protein BGZ90_011912 [Linnemannia elongata]|nr:hypothetical protein BGZ90_011912 [Linnemannia elongata]